MSTPIGSPPTVDPITYQWPYGSVPFNPGTGPMPGYVVGLCGHRVAVSEWAAGFAVCERCPNPSLTSPPAVGVGVTCRALCAWTSTGRAVWAVHPTCPVHGYDSIVARQRAGDSELHAHSVDCPHDLGNGRTIFIAWQCGDPGGPWPWMTSAHPQYRPQHAPDAAAPHAQYEHPSGHTRCATDGELWPCRVTLAAGVKDAAALRAPGAGDLASLLPPSLLPADAQLSVAGRQVSRLRAVHLPYRVESTRDITDAHDQYAATIEAAGGSAPPPVTVGDLMVEATVRLRFAAGEGEYPDEWLAITCDPDQAPAHAYSLFLVTWRSRESYTAEPVFKGHHGASWAEMLIEMTTRSAHYRKI